MGKILVVDDEKSVLNAFHELLTGLGHTVTVASSGDGALERIRSDHPDLVVTDICMPGMNGLDTFRQIRTINAKLPVIIMTGQGTMDTAIEATKLGAIDYHLKPFDPGSMVAAIERGLEIVRVMQRGVEFNPGGAIGTADAIVGESSEMQKVFKAIGRVAATEATILIRGESGTGKELVARAIYHHSLRASAPLLIVNCAAIPETLLESELFGHERGAFTDAYARRVGKFEQAHGGTIFLDEIGDMPAVVQAKVLRVLQQKTFERIGGNETICADVRVLAATNRDLEVAIGTGAFRADLYHRLNVVPIHIPPLRERRTDIPKLVEYALERYALDLKLDKPLVSEEAFREFCIYDWPGNVRELEHCVYRILIFTRGYPIRRSDVVHARQTSCPASEGPSKCLYQQELINVVHQFLNDHCGQGTHEQLLTETERLLISEALRRTNGNQTHAAHFLGLTRPTLHAKMHRHGIGLDKQEPSTS